MDGSFEVKGSLDRIIDEFINNDYDIALNVHPWRCTLYDEYKAWIDYRNYSKERANLMLDNFTYLHYNNKAKLGLYQAGLSIVRREKSIHDLNNLMLSFLNYFGTDSDMERVDQTILTYVMNVYFPHLKVLAFSQRLFDSDMFSFYNHNSNVKCTFNCDAMPYSDEGYVNGKMVKLFK